jgi:hypothetical protein
VKSVTCPVAGQGRMQGRAGLPCPVDISGRNYVINAISTTTKRKKANTVSQKFTEKKLLISLEQLKRLR